MTTDPDIQREWLLSKWERFTDHELVMLRGDLSVAESMHLESADAQKDDPEGFGYLDTHLVDEVVAEIARRQADVEAADADA